jgi:hypothetical protein
MSADELFHYIIQYAVDVFTYEEMHSMGVEPFHQYVKEHFIPIPKSELVIGKEYKGHCRNASRATWNGKVFQYMRKKFGSEFLEEINHYEDDNNDGVDVFVPVKEI